MRGYRSAAALAVAALIGIPYASGSGPGQGAAQQVAPDLAAYAAFQSDLSDLANMPIASAADVDAALDRVARHNRDALVRGWMSYAADVAVQSPAFAGGVRTAERRWQRHTLMMITSNRSFARRLPGSDDAIHRVLDALAADTERVSAVADLHRNYAYTLQTQAWAGAETPAAGERVARMRALGQPGGFAPAISAAAATQLSVAPASHGASADEAAFGGRRFWDALNPGGPVFAADAPRLAMRWRADEAHPGTLDAILSVAAIRALGAERSQASAVTYLLHDPSAVGCVEMARLQFYSCLSAARLVYENQYCLAQHGLRDVGMCISTPILRDQTFMTAFAQQAAPSAADNAEAVAAPALAAAPEAAAQAEAVPAPALAGAPEGAPAEAATPAEAFSLPGTAEAPTASPVVEVQPLPAPAPAAIPAVAAAVAAPPVSANAEAQFATSLRDLGAGELFALADELDEQGEAARARLARRTLIARFPDSPLALLAAQRLAEPRTTRR